MDYPQGFSRAANLLEVLRENPFTCLFQLVEATSVHQLIVPSFISKASGSIEPTQIIQNYLPTSRSLIMSLSPFSHAMKHGHRLLRFRMQASLRGYSGDRFYPRTCQRFQEPQSTGCRTSPPPRKCYWTALIQTSGSHIFVPSFLLCRMHIIATVAWQCCKNKGINNRAELYVLLATCQALLQVLYIFYLLQFPQQPYKADE